MDCMCQGLTHPVMLHVRSSPLWGACTCRNLVCFLLLVFPLVCNTVQLRLAGPGLTHVLPKCRVSAVHSWNPSTQV